MMMKRTMKMKMTMTMIINQKSKNIWNMKSRNLFLFALLFLTPFLFARAESSSVVSACDFSGGNLEIGSLGEDVRCLQKYLNSNGFKVADSGVGSPGNETGSFGALTREAVKKWQIARGISPATGTFGPLSRIEYLNHVKELLTTRLQNSGTGSLSSGPGSSPNVLPATASPVAVVATMSQAEKDARSNLKKAISAIEKAVEDVDDADSDEFDDDEIEDMLEDIEDSEEELREAFQAFLSGDFSDASKQAERVIDSMGDISDDLHGDDSDAEEAIADAEEALDDARDEIDEADDDGKDVRDARDLLDDAEDKLDDARDAFDDEDYDEAEDLAQEAEELADEAVDAIVD